MPIMPFLFGMVVGSAITYVAKDDSSKQLLKDTGSKITGSVSSLTGKAKGMFKKAKDEVAEAAETAEDAVIT